MQILNSSNIINDLLYYAMVIVMGAIGLIILSIWLIYIHYATKNVFYDNYKLESNEKLKDRLKGYFFYLLIYLILLVLSFVAIVVILFLFSIGSRRSY